MKNFLKLMLISLSLATFLYSGQLIADCSEYAETPYADFKVLEMGNQFQILTANGFNLGNYDFAHKIPSESNHVYVSTWESRIGTRYVYNKLTEGIIEICYQPETGVYNKHWIMEPKVKEFENTFSE